MISEWHESQGIIHYSVDPLIGHKLYVEIDPGIARLAHALIPKGMRPNKPRYAPHISVIRKEAVPKLDIWGRYEGAPVTFWYGSRIHYDNVYFWLRVLSPTLMFVRRELGLPSLSKFARPPDNASCFHTTVANCKGVPV
jgi:hypothetical protein